MQWVTLACTKAATVSDVKKVRDGSLWQTGPSHFLVQTEKRVVVSRLHHLFMALPQTGHVGGVPHLRWNTFCWVRSEHCVAAGVVPLQHRILLASVEGHMEGSRANCGNEKVMFCGCSVHRASCHRVVSYHAEFVTSSWRFVRGF